MRTWLTHLWEKYRSGFWFIPSLMTFAAMILGLLLPEVDRQFASATPVWMQSSAATARAMLTTLAGAMITAASVVFSVTIVAFSITSSQFGPSLLRNFLNDSVTQLALGACLASSLYSLLLLRAFSQEGEKIFLLTACRCVDRLGAAMRRLAQRQMPIPFQLDKENQLRVVARGYTFPRVLNCAFDQIRQHGRGNVAVSMRLLEAMEAIARVAKGENQKAVTQRQAEMVFRGCQETVAEENDRSDLSDRYRSVLEQLGVTPEDHEPFNQDWHALSGKE